MGRLFIISNRVSTPAPKSDVRAGGLEVALRATLKSRPCVWVGWSGKTRPQSQIQTRTIQGDRTSYVVTDLSQEDFQEYYNGFANRVLWPILHYRLDLAEYSRRDLSGYLRVNERFAELLDAVLAPDDIIWVHDYHLIPLASALRARGRRNRIGFFLHIPVPPPEILTALPNHERLLPTLRDYDLVGFQTDGDTRNFARYVATECEQPPHTRRTLSPGGPTMRIGTFPVGVDTKSFRTRARRAARSSFVREVVDSVPGAVMIGVDRLDYSKGLPLRFEAFERFLAANPQWRGKITYLQIAPKSRSSIPEYAEMEQQIATLAGRINSQCGDVSWTPVRYINRVYSRTALSGLYHTARIGLVTPLRDGMNLVAKEFVASQDRDDPGVLILSRFAGAAAELKAALLVNPYDPDAVAAAIARALTMPLEERIARHSALFAALLENDIMSWGDRFLASLSGEPQGSAYTPRRSSGLQQLSAASSH